MKVSPCRDETPFTIDELNDRTVELNSETLSVVFRSANKSKEEVSIGVTFLPKLDTDETTIIDDAAGAHHCYEERKERGKVADGDEEDEVDIRDRLEEIRALRSRMAPEEEIARITNNIIHKAMNSSSPSKRRTPTRSSQLSGYGTLHIA